MATSPNLTTAAVMAESSFGVVPASALQLVNVSTIKVARDVDAQRPSVLTGSRRTYPTRLLRKSGTVTIGMPGQYENDLILAEALMMGSRSAAVTLSATTIATTATTITDSGAGFGSFQTGDWVYVDGFTGVTADNRWYGPIIKTSTSVLTIPSGQTSGVHAAGDTVRVRTRRLLDGSTAGSICGEYNLTGLTTQFCNFAGARCNSLKNSWAQGSWMTQEYGFMSKVPAMAAATIGTGANTAAKTTGFLNAVDDFGGIYWGGGSVSNSTVISKLDFSIVNAMNPIYGLGTAGPSDFMVGSVAASIDATAIYDNNAQYLKAAIDAHTTLWLAWHWVDPQGNRMLYSLPAVKPAGGDIEIGQADGEPVSLPFKLDAHDSAKDPSALLYATPPSYVAAMYFIPGP